MNSLLNSIITDIRTVEGINKVEKISPRTLPDVSNTTLPWVGVAPVTLGEQWKTNARKLESSMIEIYICTWKRDRTLAIEELLTRTNAIISEIRGQTYSDYLSKPLDIASVEYTTAGYGDNYFLDVSTIVINCERIFDV